jgi:alpha-glucosidase
MKSLFLFAFFLSTLIFSPASAQKNIRLASPDGRIRFSFSIINKMAAYTVFFNGKPLIENSGLNLSFQNAPFQNLRISKPVYREADEDYELVVGKTKSVHDHYREVMIPLLEIKAPNRQINLLVRVFNDGLAFRYEYPEQPHWPSYILTGEQTEFRLAANPLVHTLFLPGFTSSHEGK